MSGDAGLSRAFGPAGEDRGLEVAALSQLPGQAGGEAGLAGYQTTALVMLRNERYVAICRGMGQSAR